MNGGMVIRDYVSGKRKMRYKMELEFTKKDLELLESIVLSQMYKIAAELVELEDMGNRRCHYHSEQLVEDKKMLDECDKLIKKIRMKINSPMAN